MSDFNSLAVIYASEGTGHKTAAFALCEAFLKTHPRGQIICFDILDIIPHWLKYVISQGYLSMARYAPWLWGSFYWGSDKPGFQSRSFEAVHGGLCSFYLPRLESFLETRGAQAAVFTHYFGAAETSWHFGGRIPVFCADTDFESHRFQRRPGFAWSFAGSSRAMEQRLREGITNVSAPGVPVSEKFTAGQSKAEARKTLKLPQEGRVILVSGGGIGAGSVAAAAKSLAREKDWQTVIICGNNKALHAKLSGYFQSTPNVRTEGYVNNMEAYYAAADCAVMKPGGLSASEALCAGLPMLLMDPVPGQEELNMGWLTSHGAAQTLVRPEKAAENVAALFEGNRLAKLSEAARKLAKPQAAAEIIEKISEFVKAE